MKINAQSGYMDAQLMPAMIGAVSLFFSLSMIRSPEFNMDENLLRLCVFLALAVAALLYGFAMHIDALGYPESPFNKHTSPLVMTLLCGGPLVFGAYLFYSIKLLPGFVLFTALSLLVVGASIGSAFYRKSKGRE